MNQKNTKTWLNSKSFTPSARSIAFTRSTVSAEKIQQRPELFWSHTDHVWSSSSLNANASSVLASPAASSARSITPRRIIAFCRPLFPRAPSNPARHALTKSSVIPLIVF